MTNTPVDRRLYDEVVAEAKRRFKVWPSAYASGWVVRTYKSRGGTYEGAGHPGRPLARWFDEKWVDVCEYMATGRFRPCGRKNAVWADYPYCRPTVRITPSTPDTLRELLERGVDLQERCARKKSDPTHRVR